MTCSELCILKVWSSSSQEKCWCSEI